MPNYKRMLIYGLILLLVGCGTDSALEPSKKSNNNIELTKISTDSSIKQHRSNQAKESLSKYKEITTVKAVNTSKEILIAIEVQHNDRFKLSKIRKQLTKEMEEQFPKMKVEFSTDKKIVLELDQLEKDIQSGSYSKEKIEKKMKKLTKLSKEQT